MKIRKREVVNTVELTDWEKVAIWAALTEYAATKIEGVRQIDSDYSPTENERMFRDLLDGFSHLD